MSKLPPLECLRYFEAAARHESFVGAAKELGLTAAAVAYRIKALEEHFGRALFVRRSRRISLNARGRACLLDVQRVLAEIGTISERYGTGQSVRRLSIAVEESVADRWLIPRLPGFRALEPDVVIDVETDLAPAGGETQDVDLWISYAAEAAMPASREALQETLFEEYMFPVCSRALLEARSHPGQAADLYRWPLLYRLGRTSDWLNWFAAQGTAAPDLSRAWGFRLCSAMVQAAVEGMGVAIGRWTLFERELQQGTLTPLFDPRSGPRTSCCLVSTVTARSRTEVRVFRDWILQEAATRRLPNGRGGAESATAIK